MHTRARTNTVAAQLTSRQLNPTMYACSMVGLVPCVARRRGTCMLAVWFRKRGLCFDQLCFAGAVLGASAASVAGESGVVARQVGPVPAPAAATVKVKMTV